MKSKQLSLMPLLLFSVGVFSTRITSGGSRILTRDTGQARSVRFGNDVTG